MFDEIKNDQVAAPVNSRPLGANLPPAPSRAEDIFAEVENTGKPEVFKPRPEGENPPRGAVIPPEMNWRNNKKIIFGLLFGGVAIVAAGAYFGLKLAGVVKTGVNPPPTVEEQPVNTEPVTTPEPIDEAEETAETPVQPAPLPPVDSDFDGLSDDEEIKLGANPRLADTDEDGLTDREEVKVYLTDPLNPDTDNDGFKDGAEVGNGYNPKGAGKLLEVK